MRKTWIPVFAALLAILASAAAWAVSYDSVLGRWSKSKDFADRGDSLSITATYYSAEFIEATIQQEADRNLWTADELERYKYQFLKTLNMEDTIPVRLAFDNRGAALHMATGLTVGTGKAGAHQQGQQARACLQFGRGDVDRWQRVGDSNIGQRVC